MEKKTYNNLVVSSAPHIVSNMDTSRIMMMVILALVPSLLVSVYVFGMRVLSLTAVCVVASVFFEWVWNVLMHKRFECRCNGCAYRIQRSFRPSVLDCHSRMLCGYNHR